MAIASTLKAFPANSSPYRTDALIGALRSDVFLTLQTRHAQQLVRGRDVKGKPRIIGLTGFADRLRLIWQAAEENDPYADWWLIKIHDALCVVDVRIESESYRVEQELRRTNVLEIVPAAAKEPFRMALTFSTPYAYRAAQSLAQYDQVVRKALTAKHIGVIGTAACQRIIQTTARKIRAVFTLPNRFRRMALDRSRPETFEVFGDQAATLMGTLPDDVKAGTRRAPIAPLIRTPAAAVPSVIEDTEQENSVFEDQ